MSVFLILAAICFIALLGAYIAGFYLEKKKGLPYPYYAWGAAGAFFLAFLIFLSLYFAKKVYAETDPHLGAWIGIVMALFILTIFIAILGKRLPKMTSFINIALFLGLGITLIILFVNMSRETLANENGLALIPYFL